MAVYGPKTTTIQQRNVYEVTMRYTTKPVDRSVVLPYRYHWANRFNWTNNAEQAVNIFSKCSCGDSTLSYPYIAKAYNIAYDKFRDDAFESAQLAASFAEGASTVGMIADRVNQMRQAYSSLRRGRFTDFIRHLGVLPLKKHKDRRWNRPHQASGIWLEYHFGWSPMVQEIYTLGQVIARYPNPAATSVGRGRNKVDLSTLNSSTAFYTGVKTTRVQIKGRVTVTNPNLFLANKIGVANPVQVVWELIPFSFLVDWFTNFGRWLSSFSDWWGVELDKLCITITHSVPAYESWYPVTKYRFSGEAYGCIRMTPNGLAGPVLMPPEIKGLSVTRAATAISLLVAVLHK